MGDNYQWFLQVLESQVGESRLLYKWEVKIFWISSYIVEWQMEEVNICFHGGWNDIESVRSQILNSENLTNIEEVYNKV